MLTKFKYYITRDFHSQQLPVKQPVIARSTATRQSLKQNQTTPVIARSIAKRQSPKQNQTPLVIASEQRERGNRSKSAKHTAPNVITRSTATRQSLKQNQTTPVIARSTAKRQSLKQNQPPLVIASEQRERGNLPKSAKHTPPPVIARSTATRQSQKNRHIPNTLKTQHGVSLTETLIMMPVFLMLTLGIIQYAFIYEAKSSLDYATFMSARAGAVDHARQNAITTGLAKSLAPLFSPETDAGSLLTKITEARLDIAQYADIKILNPTKEAFRDFAIRNPDNNQLEIPNEMLHMTSTAKGRSSKLNIQDANLLKVQVLYGYEMKVPFVNSVISLIGSWFTTDPIKRRYFKQKRLPILATATVRMQSRAWQNDWITSTAAVDKAVRDASEPQEPIQLADVERPWKSGPTGGTKPGGGAEDEKAGGIRPDDQIISGGKDNSLCEKESSCNNPPGVNDALCSLRGDCDELVNGTTPICTDTIRGSSSTAQSSSIHSSQASNPIHVITGNKYQEEIDIRPLTGQLGLEFARHYNSRTDYQHSIGYGWSHTYDVRLSRIDKSTINIRQSDGRVILFTHGQGNIYTPKQISDGRLKQLNNGGYDWQWSNGQTLQFDPDGQLHAVVMTSDNKLQLSYIGRQLYKITDPQGRTISLQHDKYGRVIAIKDPAKRVYQYTYDKYGNLLVMQRPDKSTRRYHYEDPHDPNNLTGITDERGIRYATWRYDDQDRAVLGTYIDGIDRVKLDYRDNQTLVTNSENETSIYHTEIRDGIPLVKRIDGPGCSTCGRGDIEYQYNDQFKLIEVITKEGTRTHYTYDDHGRTELVTKTHADGSRQLIARYTYVGDSHLPKTISRPSLNPDGMHTVTIQYNQYGQAEYISERGYRPTDNGFAPIERSMKLEYKNAQLIAIDGPRDDVKDIIRIGYDEQQRLKTLTGADGRTQTVQAYDHYGRPTKIQSGTKTPVELSYNHRGDVTAITQGTRTVKYGYDAAGNLKTLTGPDGNTLSFDYDKAGRATSLTGPNNRRLETELDSEGRLTQRRLISAQGDVINTVSFLYDAQGRLQSQQQDGVTRLEYDYDQSNQLTRVNNRHGDAVEMKYNNLGQLLSLTQPGAGTTGFDYNAKQQLSGITDARDNQTRYIKDDFGQVVKRISPDTGTSRYTYDAAGNRTEKTNAEGQTTYYRYDAASRLIEQRDRDGITKLSYETNSGRLQKVQGPNTTEIFDYNSEGQLIAHTREIDGKAFTTGYHYNQDGRLVEKHLPDKQVLIYHYYEDGDNKGDLRAITRKGLFGLTQTTLVGEIDSNKHDGSTGHTYHNGLRTEAEYDAESRVTDIRTDRTQDLVYYYDETGQIIGIDENGLQNRYDYDIQRRLIHAETALGHYRYRYDPVGNRTLKQHTQSNGGPVTEEYHYTDKGKGNRLTRIQTDKAYPSKLQYNYNAAGSLKIAGELRYEYNSHQRPVKVFKGKHLVAEYAYNRFGERIKKVVYHATKKPKVTYYLYDGHSLTAEADETGTITAQYLYLNSIHPIIKLEGREIYAIHTDHLGTPRAVTDDAQALVWKADFSPFGKAHIKTEQVTLNLRFPGQYEDSETGSYYNYLRDYYPEAGRYGTSDPLGLSDGMNTYAYVNGDPLSNIDPLGLYEVAIQPHNGSSTVPQYEPVKKPVFGRVGSGLPASNDPIYRKPGGASKRSPISGRLISLVNPYLLGVALVFAIDQYIDHVADSISIAKEALATHENTIESLIEQIKQYDPNYTYTHGNSWEGARFLANLLHYEQIEYINKFSTVCPGDFDPALYDKTRQDIEARNAIYNSLYGDKKNQEELLEREYRSYLANGGELSYTDWVFAGRPGSPEEVINDRSLSESEKATLVRLVKRYPDRIFRASEHEGAEYIDQDGRTYDQMGDPRNSQYWNRESFIKSIEHHLLKTNDYTVIDLTEYTATQKKEIGDYIDSLSKSKKDKIIRIGF